MYVKLPMYVCKKCMYLQYILFSYRINLFMLFDELVSYKIVVVVIIIDKFMCIFI